ncbi:MAG TPA: hypothetical protein VF458_11615, partial [Ktedonobacteraceae bacterium]
MSSSSSLALRRMVGGFQVVSPDLSLSVAERVRAAHLAGNMSVESGEMFSIRSWWIYRAHVQINGCSYIGDAEIRFGTESTTPDGTNPISCAQTEAVGQALDFAGFGDLKTVLVRLGRSAELESVMGARRESGDGSRQELAGVQTVLLDQIPSVTVRERLFHLHQTGTPFRMERCEILEIAGIWIYRVTVLVNERRSTGDTEIFFDAVPGTPDAAHPVSGAQILAVGTALALAGFGDARSVLEREGKNSYGIDVPPQLASADDLLRAQRQAQRNRSTRLTPSETTTSQPYITSEQRQQITTLCKRLGVAEPAEESLDAIAADLFIAELQDEEADLLRTAEQAEEAQGSLQEAQPPGSLVEAALVRHLKQRWRTLFHPAGEANDLLRQWSAFKQQVCQQEVSDAHMRPAQYEQLLAALPTPALPQSQHAAPSAHQLVQR